MRKIESVNDFVIKFANVNGTGSASANNMFAKSIFRMGIPVSPRNIFPSNIQGLPTWYEVRVSQNGYLGRRGGVDIFLCVNPQSMRNDIAEVETGGYFIYDSTKILDKTLFRKDIEYIGIPFTRMCLSEYSDARQRLLFKNMVYVGSLSALLNIDFQVLKELLDDQFKGKEKLITPNVHAMELGYQYATENFDCPLSIRLENPSNLTNNKKERRLNRPYKNKNKQILMDGNTATALGAIYSGATVAGWYPITPSTSVVEAFERYARRLRIDPGTGKNNFAIVQAEDELSAIGVAIGAAWNGARAFTATSGPGLSLMTEFLGLAYFAEIPVVLINVQRAGPSTGMPTRTQQSDILAAAYASHGDTKQILLFPATPQECFSMAADAFDLADRLQTPIIMMSDLDLGMNVHMSPPLEWDDNRKFDRGKVLSAKDLEKRQERFGRYLDVDGDGIAYRTYPGTHPEKGSFFTRGTSRDAYAIYTEDGQEYVKNMDRLLAKFKTAKQYVPRPKTKKSKNKATTGAIFFGTSASPCYEAVDILAEEGYSIDTLRLRAFPFNQDVKNFIDSHKITFVVEQNRDGQMRRLLINEGDVSGQSLVSILNYDGQPITARYIATRMRNFLSNDNVTPIRRKAVNEAKI